MSTAWNSNWGHPLEYIPGASHIKRYDLVRSFDCLIGHIVQHRDWRERYHTIPMNVKKSPEWVLKWTGHFEYYDPNWFPSFGKHGWNQACQSSSIYQDGYYQFYYFGKHLPCTLEIKHWSGQYYVAVGYFKMDNQSFGWNLTDRRPYRINIKALQILALFRSQVAEGGHPINGSLVHEVYSPTIQKMIGLCRIAIGSTQSRLLFKEYKKETRNITFSEMIDILKKDGLYYD